MHLLDEFSPFRLEAVEDAVWKRLMENGEFREIQKRFDAMLEAIGKADEQKAFTFD